MLFGTPGQEHRPCFQQRHGWSRGSYEVLAMGGADFDGGSRVTASLLAARLRDE
jgi:hypothetical protein